MDIGFLLDRAAIAPRISAASKRQALSVAAEIAGRTYGLKPSTVLNALLRREAQGSTGIGHGVATPHARLRGLDQMRGVFMRLESPIEFDALDDQPVDLMFCLLSPVEAPGEHLLGLAKISRILRPGDTRMQLRQASGVDAIQAILAQTAHTAAA